MADDYDGPCAGAPDTIFGTGTITDGACAGRTITATGSLSVTSGGAVSATSLSGATLTVQGSSVTVPSLSSAFGPVVVNATGGAATLGTINAGGSFSVTASTSVTASGALVSSYGPSVVTASNGAVLLKDVTVTSGQVTITSTGGTITTDNITAAYELDIKSNGAFAINTKILTVNDGNIKVDSGKTLTIVGLTKSTLYDIELKAVNDLKADIIEAGRNLSVTSTSGKVDTKDLTADQGTLKVKADNKITIVGITKTNKLDIDLDAKNIVKTNAITSGSHIRVNSTDENINITSTVDSNIDDTSGGNILLTANKSIFTKSINTHGNTKVGSVRIVANKGGANTLFIVGTTATTNGVKGTITTNTVSGGGTSPSTFNFGISIQNGTVASTGGITLVSAANLKVAASNSKAGTIILDAKNGTLTLPAGTLNANAASGKLAGSIVLLAKTVTTASGTILSATQTSAAPASGHSISIAAETLNLAGPTGLKIQTNGKGVPGYPALASLSPQGSVTVFSDDNSVFFMYWQLNNFSITLTAKPLTVAGAAPLTVISDGDDSQVLASGRPLKFSNSALTLQSRGKTNHRVDVVYNGADDGSTNIVFDNTLTNVTLDANAVGGGAAGGKVNVYGDKIDLSATVFNITAIGPVTGNGNGGELYFRSTEATLNPASKVSFKADAATVGTGNAIVGDVADNSAPKAIIFYPGAVSVDIGNANGQYFFSANGGGNGGNGGTIVTSAAFGVNIKSMTPGTASAISASAIGGNGKGGEVKMFNSIISLEGDAKISAVGHGNGEGGKFSAYYFNPAPDTQLNVNQHFKVDGGDAVPLTSNDGLLEINDILCRQWKLNTTSSFPVSYWNCVNPNAPVSLDEVPKTVAQNIVNSSSKSLMNNFVSIFVHENSTKHNSFFNDTASGVAPGITIREPNVLGVKISISLMENCFACQGHSGAYTFNATELGELTAHELGHALNFQLGTNPEHTSSTYTNYQRNDLLNLDYSVVGSTPETSTQRAPCSLANDGSAPLDQISARTFPNQPSQPVCFNGAFNTAVFGTPPAGTLNSALLQRASGNLAREELFAQAFAFKTASNSANYIDQPLDGVLQRSANGGSKPWFACTLTRAEQLSIGTGSIPSGCDIPVHTWYENLLGESLKE